MNDHCEMCCGPCDLAHCDHCGAKCDPERIYVRGAGRLPFFPASAEDGVYHLCPECADEYGIGARPQGEKHEMDMRR